MSHASVFPQDPQWAGEGTSRIPFALYTQQDSHKKELARFFYKDHWSYVGLDAEIPNPGDFKRTVIGERSVIMTRSQDGQIHVVENVCAHRGMQFCRERHGNKKEFVCPYHQWSYALDGTLHAKQCADNPKLTPCIFEYVYLARPDSVMDGISVYQARLNLGEALARRVVSQVPPSQIDVVIPIPESSRPSAAQLAQLLGLPYREGFVKNRYVGRTFIMPGQAVRKRSVRQKLNAIVSEFKGRNVLLVDDSIVRGTTSREIVQMARDAGARKVYMASAAPPVRYPNVYGIDMPTSDELVAYGRTVEEVRVMIGCDALIYQDVEGMKAAVRLAASDPSSIQGFDASCFDGVYVTGDITAADIARMGAQRSAQDENDTDGSRLTLPNPATA